MQNQNLPILSGQTSPLEWLKGSPQSLDAFAALLPASIDKALSYPSLAEIVEQMGTKEPVLRFLENELIKVNDLLNLPQKLTGEMVVFIAAQFVERFSSYSLADFKICLMKGCIGDYDKENPKPLYNFDGIVFRRWWEKYKEEKYDAEVRKMYKQRDKIFNPLAVDPHGNVRVYKGPVSKDREKWHLKRWLEQTQNAMAPKRASAFAMTPEEIKQEGQVRPVEEAVVKPRSTSWDDIVSKELHIIWIRENHDRYGKAVPGFVDENTWRNVLFNDEARYKKILKSIKGMKNAIG